MKYLVLLLSLFTLSVSAQTLLPDPSTPTTHNINYALGGGLACAGTNTYTASIAGLTTYSGFAADLQFTNANTSTTTSLNITNSNTSTALGAKSLKKYSSGALVDLAVGDISDGSRIRFYYNGTYLVMMGGSGGGSGTVTSVAITVPSIMSVTGSPVTTSGTMSITLNTQTANTIFSGPVSGSTASPSFRSMVTADIPNSTVTIPKISATGTASSTTFLRGDGSWSTPAGGGSTTLGSITADPFNYPATGNTLDVFGGRSLGKLQKAFNDYTLPTVTGLNMKIVSDGNSNSVGYNLPAGDDYPTFAYNTLGGSGAGYSISNNGVSGQTTQDMQTDAVSQIDAQYNGAKTRNFLFAWEVENDVYVNGVSSSTAATNMLNYWSGRKATGFYVIGATSPLRGNNPVVNDTIEATNVRLRAGTSNYNALVDIPTIPILSNIRGSGFQADNTHFSLSGVNALSDAYVSKVRTALSQTDFTPANFVSWNGNTPDRTMTVGPLNNNALSFLSNGKIRAEVTNTGTFSVIGDVSAASGSGIGLLVSPALTATANGDILSDVVFKPAYFNSKSYTGIVRDIFQIQDKNGVVQSRWDENGKMFWRPTFTAVNNNDTGGGLGGTITGYSSGTFNHFVSNPTFNFAANSTGYIHWTLSPTINRGAYSGTASTTLFVNSGAAATSSDAALVIGAVEGEGIKMSGHSGSTYAMNIFSSTSGTVAAIGGSNTLAFNCYRLDGTGHVALFQNLTTSNASSNIDLITYNRPVTLSTGGGMSFNYFLGSSTGTIRTAGRSDVYWVDATNSAEVGGYKWSTMQAGTLAEGMRLEGKNLIVAGNLSAAAGNVSYDQSSNTLKAVSGLSLVGSGTRGNNFYFGINHIDSTASGNTTKWNTFHGEQNVINNNGAAGSTVNNSFLSYGFGNSIRVKSGSISQIYNSGVIGGRGNYFDLSSVGYVGSSIILGGLNSRINISGKTIYGSAIVGGEKSVLSVTHSVALGGYKLIASDTGTVVVPFLKLQYVPVNNDTVVHVLVRDNTTGIVKTRRAPKSGSFSATGTATTTFTVTIGATQPSTSYKVAVTPTSLLAVGGYATNKTTTTFDWVVPAATGTVSLDYTVFP
jgi:hypothetical protein